MKEQPLDWDSYFQQIENQIERQSAMVDKKNLALRMAAFLLDIQPEATIVARGLEIINKVLKLR